ncbi:MAG: AAA family ATPase [Thermoguttaceae bacterium]|nr:AAA family ATPase [Thermoguttaceae bacterium]
MSTFIEEIERCVPTSSTDAIPWDRLERLFAPTCFSAMKTTPQNPLYHGEGDVYAHTKATARELIKSSAFQEFSQRKKTELFLATVLHDVGKVKTTRMEDGAWTSPGHASTGARIVREFLWRDCGLCGTPEAIVFRETVCALVRFHMVPGRLIESNDPERKVREIAARGELATDFSWNMLSTLAEADAKGRISMEADDCLTRVRLAEIVAEEALCANAPYRFPDAFTRRAYLSGRDVAPGQPLYDDSWGEVVLMSGLPGTGKDAWLRKNCPDLPTISLDEIRKELRIAPTDDQGRVAQLAEERAKELLRNKRPFVWNSTNVTRDIRRKQIGLFERYGARVRIVYLETDWATRIERNVGRENVVPESAVERLLGKTELPTLDEAQNVQWICV